MLLLILLILLLDRALQSNPRLLDIALQKDLIFLDLNFFILFIRKKINLRHRAGHLTSKASRTR
jgi:hypothetical protein